MTDLTPLLKSKFKYVWVSQILSQITINIMNFLLLIKLFSETSSSIATSLLWVAYALPAILIGPIAAVTVDLMDRRLILIVTNFLQGVLILGYAFVSSQQIFLPFFVVFSYSFLNQFYLPAESATVPSVVKTKLLPNANGLFFITQQIALIIGFGLAGPISRIFGFKDAFTLCAIFLFLAFVSVTFLPKSEVAKQKSREIEDSFVKFFMRIYEGYKFIKEERIILFPFLLLIFIQVILTIVAVNVPIIAEDIFNVRVDLAGVLIVVPAGFGTAVGAFIIPWLIKMGWPKTMVIERSMMVMVSVLTLFIFLIPDVTLIFRLIFGILFIFLLGITFVGILIPSQTLIQEGTPAGMIGRVFGNFWFLTTIATIFPVILSGTIAEIFGIRMMFFIITAFIFGVLMISRRITKGSEVVL